MTQAPVTRHFGLRVFGPDLYERLAVPATTPGDVTRAHIQEEGGTRRPGTRITASVETSDENRTGLLLTVFAS